MLTELADKLCKVIFVDAMVYTNKIALLFKEDENIDDLVDRWKAFMFSFMYG